MEHNQQQNAQIKWQKMSKTLRNLCKIKIESIYQNHYQINEQELTFITLFFHFSCTSDNWGKRKTFEMILRHRKFKEFTMLSSILKQNHLIHPSKHFLSLLFVIIVIILHGIQVLSRWRYNIKIPGEPSENTDLWTAQLWTEPFCNPLEPWHLDLCLLCLLMHQIG